jgi:NADH:ubiquinone oxidoreductase subunit K
VTQRGELHPDAPGRVLRLALVLWGLGDLALGRRSAAVTWLISEAVALAAIVLLVIGFGDTTWYVVPFVAGIAFIATWVVQAVRAYGHAQRTQGAIGPTPPRSPAAAIAWLCLPLLAWGTGFWLVGGGSSSPAAVVDRFETAWPPTVGGARLDPALQLDVASEQATRDAIERLQGLCAAGSLSADCADAPGNLLREVRFSIAQASAVTATATAQLVSFERRPSHFLGIFPATDLVAVPRETLLVLRLQAVDALLPGGIDLGARRWQIVGATAP